MLMLKTTAGIGGTRPDYDIAAIRKVPEDNARPKVEPNLKAITVRNKMNRSNRDDDAVDLCKRTSHMHWQQWYNFIATY